LIESCVTFLALSMMKTWKTKINLIKWRHWHRTTYGWFDYQERGNNKIFVFLQTINRPQGALVYVPSLGLVLYLILPHKQRMPFWRSCTGSEETRYHFYTSLFPRLFRHRLKWCDITVSHCTVKPANEATSIKQSPVLKVAFFLSVIEQFSYFIWIEPLLIGHLS